MWVQSLGREDLLEEEMAKPLQYSCLGNPMERGAWWATVHGVAKSQTRPERLSTAGLHKKQPWKPAWGCLSRECWVLKAQRAVWALDEPASLASRMHPPEVGARAEEAQSEQSSGWPSDSSLGITRELSGNAETQAPSQTPGIRICILAVQVIHMHVTV